MTTIKITDNRAIVIDGYNVALAEWKTTKVKNKDTGEHEEKSDWYQYSWPSSVDRAVDMLAQEFVSDMQLTVSMKEFKALYKGAIDQIKAKIDGEGS